MRDTISVSSSASLSPSSSVSSVLSSTSPASSDPLISCPLSPSIPSSPSLFKVTRQSSEVNVKIAFPFPLPKRFRYGRSNAIFVRGWTLIRLLRRMPHALVFLVMPALIFRLKFMILTHNSLNLSAFVALIFVYLPAKFLAFVYTTLLVPRQQQVVTNSTAEYAILGKEAPATHGVSRFTLRNMVMIVVGISYTVFVYTYGLQSPYPSRQSAEYTRFAQNYVDPKTNDAYFIAANFYNNDDILPTWTAEMAKLINVLGSDNVYVSLAENDSQDNTASSLLRFSRYMHHHGVQHTLNITSGLRPLPLHDPWIDTQTRISYMTTIRNIALAPLKDVSSTQLGSRMKYIIFLNDVIYRHTDVLKLLDAVQNNDNGTGSIMPVVMACGMDMQTATLYDQWADRDICGNGINGMYPFFSRPKDRKTVRKATLVDVGTCWNGLVVMNADPFLSPPRTYDYRRQDAGDDDADDTHIAVTTKLVSPLRFPTPPKCTISECTSLPLALLNSYLLTSGGRVRPRIVMDTSVIVAYQYKWWWYYAYFLRTPIVSVWVDVVERPILRVWEAFGFGSLYQWNELDDGCVVDRWIHCPSSAAKPGSNKIRLLMPDMDLKTVMDKQQRKDRKIKDIELRKLEDLRMEERMIMQI
ncbi:cryptococcal mannosyltransferase 1-domain-containing protein [Lipomyces kononenkoae]|uniref:Cryptococcal mannosyltransferase 1-domain-containing protein n=1 Tax=Lipomyces kononenkoae TaxID=34357 RepID=A0ACC3SSF0_LIPKO